MKFRKIVAAVDETPAGMHALRVAATLAQRAGAQLIALRVVPDPWSQVRPEEIEPLRGHRGTAPADIAQERATGKLQQLIGDTLGAVSAEAAVTFGIAGIELARWSRLHDADLLVVGRQPLGRFERRPAGRTITGILQEAALPCLIVPFGQRSLRSVLAVEDPPGGVVRVHDAAVALAALWGATPSTIRIETMDAHRSLVTASHAPAEARAPAEYADPVGETLKIARRDEVNVIVTTYPSGEDRLLDRAPCAVLLVPR